MIEEKRVEASTPVKPGSTFARRISDVANPLFVALPTFLVAALATAPNVLQALFWWGITAVGISVAPFLFIWQGVRQGRYTDHHVSRREQRLIPLLFGLGCMVVVFVLLLLLAVPPALIATVTAALVSLAIALAITQLARYKISLHMVGITGAVTICCLLFGPALLVLSPLILLVGWARWNVRAHTPLQAFLGSILAVSVTTLIFWLFGVL